MDQGRTVARIIVGMLLVVALDPPAARTASPEEDAALMLYEAGKNSFKRGRYAEAVESLEKAWLVVQNPFIGYYLGRAYAANHQCDKALPFLVDVRGQFEGRNESERVNDEVACRLELAETASSAGGFNKCLELTRGLDDLEASRRERAARERTELGCHLGAARAAVAAGDCVTAMPHLSALPERLEGDDRTWRDETVVFCEARVTEFLTDTVERKSAYKLYLAGKEALSEGRGVEAVELLDKALKLVDEPVIRRELANAHLKQASCTDMVTALRGIAPEARTAEDSGRLSACLRYRAHVKLDAAQLTDYIAMLTKARSATDAGDLATSNEQLKAAYALGHNPDVAAWRVDQLFDARSCREYVMAYDALDTDARRLIAQRETRVAHCRAELGGVQPHPGDVGGDDTAAWTLIISGGAAAVGAVVFGGLYASEVSDMEDAQGRYQSLVDSGATESVVAPVRDEAVAAQQSASDYSLGAWISGGLAVGALATGFVLLLTSKSGPSTDASTSVLGNAGSVFVTPTSNGAALTLGF